MPGLFLEMHTPFFPPDAMKAQLLPRHMSRSQDYGRHQTRSYPDVFATSTPLRARPQLQSRVLVPCPDDTSVTTTTTLRLSISTTRRESYRTRSVKRTFSDLHHIAVMAPAFLSTFMPKGAMADYIELKRDEWNNVVDDETQGMVMTQEEEIRYLSRRSRNRTLDLHPHD